ncbi:hypothetical protein OBBRIDRAFT_819519 [Obba rivulosa]|uniref:ASX DEUBAD domain-containing protein n=1 Tax=Obba rivulosa TaxID=1052685 RepID=A0A8E2AXF6_9APHY|nr:hypothetical protein OBBRIDRAFT_819519 [Obba rivulosa]
MDSSTVAGRPRRTARPTLKAAAATAPPPPAPSAPKKQKTQDAEKSAASKLEYLLTNSKSKLTQLDISEILSYSTFLDLSKESQDLLVALLPPTAFATYQPTVSPTHVDYVSSQVSQDSANLNGTGPSDVTQAKTTATLDPTVFTSPHFLSAARTFQDHLYSGWLTQKAAEDTRRFEEGIRTGTMHAEWKDEEWEADHVLKPKGKNKRGRPMNLTLLAQRGILKEGDVLSYRREFSHLQIVVEKDLLIQTIHPRTHTLAICLSPGTTPALPPPLLTTGQELPDVHILSMDDICDPEDLETGVLDVDSRVHRSERSHVRSVVTSGAMLDTSTTSQAQAVSTARIHAWKAFTVWRWREEMHDAVDMHILQERGGRERVGTLYYLREHCHS